jgi:hypothetical protein
MNLDQLSLLVKEARERLNRRIGQKARKLKRDCFERAKKITGEK